MSELSEAQIEQRRRAALKDGTTSAFAKTGDETALTDPQRSRLAELREQVQTREGAVELLQERAARAVAICEFAEDWLQSQAEKGVEVFTLPMMQRYFTASAEARRSLETLLKTFGSGNGDLDAGKVLEEFKRGKQAQ